MPSRSSAVVVTLLSLAVAAGAAPVSPALADDRGPVARSRVAAVPTTGVLAVQGHGWGHGHGVSQWGAQGGASLGQTASQMLDAYYPGTVAASSPRTSLRVWISLDEGKDTAVRAAPGLAVTDLAGAPVDAAAGSPTPLPTGADKARWRVVPNVGATTLAVQSSADGASWTTYPPMASLTGPVRLSDDANVLRLDLPGGAGRDYRGRLVAVETSTDVLKTIDVLDPEDYLRGVVPRESPSGWRPAALQVQAVAARSYATYEADHAPAGRPYDICDTDACQVYGGMRLWSSADRATALEQASTDQAIADTGRTVRTFQGKAIFAQFASSNGGWSSNGGQPYLTAHADPWDGVDPANSGHTWSASLTAADVQRRYPTVGTLTGIEVTQRDGNGDWGGRVQKVLLHGTKPDGTATSVEATGYGVYQARSWPSAADGLRSEWWDLDPSAPQPPAPPAPGLVTLAPVAVLESGSRPLAPDASRRVPVAVPAGATMLLVNVTVRGSSARPGSLLVGPSGGRMVTAAAIRPRTTTTGLVLVPAPADGRLAVRPTRSRVGVRLAVVGAVVPGGASVAPSGRPLLRATAPTTVTVPTGVSLLGVTAQLGATVTVAGVPVVGSGSVLVRPDEDGKVRLGGRGPVTLTTLAAPSATNPSPGVRAMVPRSAGRSVARRPSQLAVPGARPGTTVLLLITSTAAAKVWPAGTRGPAVTVPAGGQVTTVLTLRDGRVNGQALTGSGTLTVVPLAELSR